MSLIQENQTDRERCNADIIAAALIVSINDQGDYQKFKVHDVRKQLLQDTSLRTASDKRSCNPTGQKIVYVLTRHPELFTPNYTQESNKPRRIRYFTRTENQEP